MHNIQSTMRTYTDTREIFTLNTPGTLCFCFLYIYMYMFVHCKSLWRRILDDLSSADATLKAAGTDPLALAAAATLQAQQVNNNYYGIDYNYWFSILPSYYVKQAALQQAAAGGLANPSLIPGLLQGMQSLAAGVTTSSSASSLSASDIHIPAHIMMQPLQQSVSNFIILLNTSVCVCVGGRL